MRIHSFSWVLAFPLVMWFAAVLLLTFKMEDPNHSYWLIPPVILLVAVYVFHPQIDFWWFKYQPPLLDEPILQWLSLYSGYFKSLEFEDKKKFASRMALFIKAKEFIAIGEEREKVPEDIKAIASHNAIKLTMDKEKFMLNPYERIILYKHAFPSPIHKFLHTVETHHEDGVIIFSIEHLVPGITRQKEFYDISMHGYAEACLQKNPSEDWIIPSDFKEKVGRVVPYGYKHIQANTGFEQLNDRAVAITLYMTNKDQFRDVFPDMYVGIKGYLGQQVEQS